MSFCKCNSTATDHSSITACNIASTCWITCTTMQPQLAVIVAGWLTVMIRSNCELQHAGTVRWSQSLDCGSRGHNYGCCMCHCSRHWRLLLWEIFWQDTPDGDQPQKDGGRGSRGPNLQCSNSIGILASSGLAWFSLPVCLVI